MRAYAPRRLAQAAQLIADHLTRRTGLEVAAVPSLHGLLHVDLESRLVLIRDDATLGEWAAAIGVAVLIAELGADVVDLLNSSAVAPNAEVIALPRAVVDRSIGAVHRSS